MLQASNVLTDDVELEIHAGSNLDVVEIRVLVGVRDDAHLERVIAGVANRQAHAVDGDTALVDAKIAALCHFSIGSISEGEAVATVFAHFVDTNGGVIYVALDDVPIQTSVHHHRSLDVDFGAYAPFSEVTALERFVHGRYDILVARLTDDGQANSIVCHALIDAQFGCKVTLECEMHIFLFFFDAHYACRRFYNS